MDTPGFVPPDESEESMLDNELRTGVLSLRRLDIVTLTDLPFPLPVTVLRRSCPHSQGYSTYGYGSWDCKEGIEGRSDRTGGPLLPVPSLRGTTSVPFSPTRGRQSSL